MSTHRHSLRGYRNTCVPLFLIGWGLLLALQLLLAPVAFASSTNAPVSPPSTPSAPSNEGFALARVSVVRLLVSYTVNGNVAANCTALGVVVRSVPLTGQSASKANDWVLTDSSVVNQEVCASGSDAGTLSQVQIFFNSSYNASKTPVADSNASPLTNLAIMCFNAGATPTTCNAGPVLIPFQGEEAPFVDVAPPSSASTAGIVLTDAAGNAPTLNDTPNNDSAFLTPQALDLNAQSQLEVGAPLIDTSGQLTGLRSSGASSSISLSDISSLMGRIPVADNSVDTNWKAGMSAFYGKSYAAAQRDFQQAATDNPNFQGAGDFETLAKNPPHPSNTSSSGSQPTGSGFVIPGTNISLGLWEASVAALVVFALLLLLASVVFGPRVRRRREFKADLSVADRQADRKAQEIEQFEASQRAFQEPTLPIQRQALEDKTLVHQLPREFRCPNCGEVVMPDANFCPNCRAVLSPTESGLHRQIRLPAPPAQGSFPANPYANPQVRSVPPPPAMTPMGGSIADMPTIVQAPVPMSPTNPVVERSTAQGEPTVTMKFPDGMDVTLPQKRLGFLVGTRSDPGIKRKYKPNEDSLLAAQGVVSMPVPQPFGLFVVADGMGGHANGQDASRLAIQMITENILPRLVTDTTGSIDYPKVLMEGIQSANQAVHQQNMDKRGDMGTTITSALVVGAYAYVVNVGDSRTYLYREAKGLQKVTNDHSVVASLVEAGIIKPDDIYTHPKRNQIYRSLGEKATVEIDEFTVHLREGDKLLLCSDGLWDMVRDPKIEEVIKRSVPDPSMTGDALIQSALEGGGEDNVSVIVVQITEGGNIEALPRVQVLAKPDTVQVPQF